MNTNTAIALVLIVAGIVLIIFGIRETESFQSDISRFFRNSPTDRAIWMLIGGAIATVIGLAQLSFGRSRPSRGY